jgi:hypothetical protein
MALLFIVVAAGGNLAHDYYQLPLIPAAAIFFGAAAAPLFDGAWIGRRIGGGTAGILATSGAILALGLLSFYYSGVIQSHFRPTSLDTRIRAAGEAIDRVTPNGSLAIVVDDYGVNSPLLFYYAHLKGWSFDARQTQPALVEVLRRRGAVFFATTNWPRLQAQRPETAAMLERFEQVPLQDPPAGSALFDLTRRRGEPGS